MIVPALAGCVTFGETVEDAIEMAKEAIEGYIEILMELGKEVPTDNDVILMDVGYEGLDWQVDEYSRARAAHALAANVQKWMTWASLAKERIPDHQKDCFKLLAFLYG